MTTKIVELPIPTRDEVIAALWARYQDDFPGPSPSIAYALGAASFKPGQRSAQDALGSGNQINIFDLTPFHNGWKIARSEGG